MAKRFLSGVQTSHITITDEPLLPSDGTNKSYVDARCIPVGGSTGQVLTKKSGSNHDVEWVDSLNNQTPTDISIDMGTFDNPNGNLDLGVF